jgi:hypothetical protein
MTEISHTERSDRTIVWEPARVVSLVDSSSRRANASPSLAVRYLNGRSMDLLKLEFAPVGSHRTLRSPRNLRIRMRVAIELFRTMHIPGLGGASMIDTPPSPGMCILGAIQERAVAAVGIRLETFGC